MQMHKHIKKHIDKPCSVVDEYTAIIPICIKKDMQMRSSFKALTWTYAVLDETYKIY